MMELIEISPEEAYEILADEELFDRVKEDGVIYETFKMPTDSLYFGIFTKTGLIGFWWLTRINATVIDIHCNIIKDHRKHGLEAGKQILRLIKTAFPTDIQKINCLIPVTYPDVYNFTKKFGFQDEGLDRKSISKGGELVDRHMLGLLREEIE